MEPYHYAGVKKPAGEGKAGQPAPVPHRMSQIEWADAYFNSIIHPIEKQGVDFWWQDWQQWKYSRYVPGLSNFRKRSPLRGTMDLRRGERDPEDISP